MLERISIELSQRCSKGCPFCYAGGSVDGETHFSASDVLALVRDAAAHGVRAVSFGGGEPLEAPALWPVLEGLENTLFRSLTTNGLPLSDKNVFDRLVASRPNKVQVSIHFPEDREEVSRVIEQVSELERRGVPSGINLLVRRSGVEAARAATKRIHGAGIDNRRMVFLPMRGRDTPSPEQVGDVAGAPFQSTSCLSVCGPKARFCSIRWDRSVAWCSYTESRRRLMSLSYVGIVEALAGLGVTPCEERSSPADIW